MFYDIQKGKLTYENVLKVPTTFEVEGEEVEGEDTYILENLDDESLRELGFARVVEGEQTQEIPPFMQNIPIANYDSEKNLFFSGFVLEPKSLEDGKEEALLRLNALYEEQINQVLGAIPLSEILTWSEQEKEAKKFLESQNEADAPTLRILSLQRGIPLNLLCEKALQKAESYRLFSASIIGKRQAAEDRINLANDLESLKAILQEFGK